MTSIRDIEEVDVLITGAGPSASVAASILSESGMEVLMLERKMEIGSPVVCSDMVNMSFPEIQSLRSDPRIMIRDLDSFDVASQNRTRSFRMTPSFSENDAFNAVVERDRLDKEMASDALIKGAKLQIRSELIGYEEQDDSIRSVYRKAGKERVVKSRILILSTGMGSVGGVTNATGSDDHFIYRYNRKIGPDQMRQEVQVGHDETVNFSISRYSNEHNSLSVYRENIGTEPHPEPSRNLILAGSVSVSIPHSFRPGKGNVINAGSFSGLYDPFFFTGFREALLSGRMAARSIKESSGKDISGIYRKNVEEGLLPGIDYSRNLRRLISKSTSENVNSFFDYLSGFDFEEISTTEIFKKTGLTDSELEEMLLPDH